MIQRPVYMCRRCYDAECERMKVRELEVYTTMVGGSQCSYCGGAAKYHMPGQLWDYAPPPINEVR